MRSLWILSVVTICAKFSTCTFNCNDQDECQCYRSGSEVEIQCPRFPFDNPSNYKGVVIHVEMQEKQSLIIDCYKITNFTENVLPNVTLGVTEALTVSSCPLFSFKKMRNHLSMMQLKRFRYENFENVSLSKTDFEGLNDLEELNLNLLQFSHLDDDIFEEMTNLSILEMERNKNLTLTPNFFKGFTKLKKMYLADNEFDSIPDSVFRNLRNLQTLHLWGNNLERIEKDSLRGLSNLKSLELSYNRIETISERAFETLTQLSAINLSGNKLDLVTPNTFKDNKRIKTILMRENRNLTILDFSFANLPSLEEVDLKGCYLVEMYEHIFENSTSLAKISLSENKFRNLPPTLFKGLVNLKVLILSDNLISWIGKDIFGDLTNLEEVDLERNRISQIHYDTFGNKRNLKIINLSHNQYSGERRLLQDVQSLESLDLSDNLIKEIEEVIISENLQKLKNLDLSFNFITKLKFDDLRSFGDVFVNLDNNNITEIDFDLNYGGGYRMSEISLSNNPIDCNCNAYNLTELLRTQQYGKNNYNFKISTNNLTCARPLELEGRALMSVLPEQLTCPESTNCPKNCTCHYRTVDHSIIIDCSKKNFTEFPELNLTKSFNHTELHLEENLLSYGPNSSLNGYESVTKLFLSYNRINTITWLPPQLKVLTLHNNSLSRLNPAIVDVLNNSDLVNITLENNRWSCDCDLIPLTNFLRLHSKKVHNENIPCFGNSTKFLINLYGEDLCAKWNIIYYVLLVVVLVFVITAAALVAVFYRYNYEIKVWLYTHKLCMWAFPSEKFDKDKVYDAFISFAQEDQDFVVQNLLPVLESGSQPYKLCVHSRDFEVGEFLTIEGTKAIVQSRRTVIVLSPNFVKDVWGTNELRTAHTQAMTEGKNGVIIILYGDIDVENLDKELKVYLKTNTYLKWGDPYFWPKLKYALPHWKHNPANSGQKMANVMRCIDDKLNLVAPATPNSGSTPPILALDPSGLKKPAFNFVPRPEEDIKPAETGYLLVSSYF